MTVPFHAVADHLHAAVLANRGKGMDGALEGVEGVRVPPGILTSKDLSFRTPTTNAPTLTVALTR
jgi:hypothetical protein